MTNAEENPLPILGYTDRLSVCPGESIEFKVSCDFPKYRADIVRLRRAGTGRRGPGLKEEIVATEISDREFAGRMQAYQMGSFVSIPTEGLSLKLDSFAIQAWIYPSLPKRSTEQYVLSWLGTSGRAEFGLFVSPEGQIGLRVVDVDGVSVDLRSGRSMRSNEWYFVAASYDTARRACLEIQEPLRLCPDDPSSGRSTAIANLVSLGQLEHGRLVIGARESIGSNGQVGTTGHFNGKIDSPCLFSSALTEEALDSIKLGLLSPLSFEHELIGAWDFSKEISSTTITDASRHGLHGFTVNNPKRAVTGHNWTGREMDFKRAPHEYGAVYFHEDDLDDARWETDFAWTVPPGMRSGVYAARLQSGTHVDYVPFFVRPGAQAPKRAIAFLVPTLSYIAYANFHAVDASVAKEWVGAGFRYPVTPTDKYLVKTNLMGFYDLHVDSSGVSHVTRLMPLLDLRPEFEDPLLDNGKGGMHQFPADMCLVDWLETKGFEYDVITDEDLHAIGPELLRPYNVVLTGSHPEYYTERMLDSLQSYLDGGGRLMYLGGNGFYWVTSVDPHRPHIIELRRWGGTQGWRSAPGEYYHSTTGEMGGIWRNRGRPPQRLVGVGFTSQGIDRNRPYQRMPDSYDPRVAFIFDGIGRDEMIGDFDNLVNEWGAAGFENDRLDFKLGTSPNALLLATARGFSDKYQCALEEVDSSDSKQGGTISPLVKADIVYFDCPKGGAVFSVGSISWITCLLHNNCENNVSRMTENVLRRFATR